VNVRPVIAALIAAEVATLAELQTVYSSVDAHDMLEVINVNAHNVRVLREKV
jgi:hypothetical protein